MGIFDKIGKISDKFSTEETVMEVSYEDDSEEYSQQRQAIKKNDDFLNDTLEEIGGESFDDVDTAFGVSDDFDFIGEKQREYEAFEKGDPKKNPTLATILESLGISKDIAVPSNVFMAEDLDGVDFNIETPRGYDRGQVKDFYYQVVDTVKGYMTLLEQRNDDVVALASEVDRLTRTNQELMIDNDFNNQGISFMTTSDYDDLEAEAKRLTTENARLRERIQELESGGTLSETERDRFNKMQDYIAIQQREIEDLQEEVQTLKVENEEIREDKDDDIDVLMREQGMGQVPQSAPRIREERTIASSMPDLGLDEPSQAPAMYDDIDDEDYDDDFDELMKNRDW